MSKDDEKVWVFPRCMLSKFKELPGITCVRDEWLYFHEEILECCRFMRRGDVEEEPSLQQPIPYVVCRNGKLILLYNRGEKGAEKRLSDKWSIGVGGHINPKDKVTDKDSPFQILLNAMHRELVEELTSGGFHIAPPRLEFFGLLKTSVTPVDDVHFGVIFTAEFISVTSIASTEEIERHKWVTLEELKEYKLETWSEMVLEELLKDEAKK